MNNALSDHLKEVYKISDKDCARVIQLFEPLEIKKNEHLYRAGQVVRYVYFVEQGCLRQYYINNNGEERTIYFKTENGWCSELVSFLDKKPTELYVQALEHSKLQMINQKNWVYAVTSNRAFTMGFIRAQTGYKFYVEKKAC